MRKNRVIEQNRCYHLISRLAHRAFFLDDEEKDRAVALMRRVEAGVQASTSYCINRAVSNTVADPSLPWDGEDWSRIFHNCAHWTDMILKSQGCKGVESHFPGYRLPPAWPRY